MKPKRNDETSDQRLTQDFQYLEPFGGFGSVDEVNGEGAVEAFSFAATRHELLQLAKYWIERELDIRYWWFLYEQVCSTEIRLQPFAIRRIGRIARVLGDAAVGEAQKEVLKKFSAETNPVLWEMFLKGKQPDRDETGFPIIPPVPATSDVTRSEGNEAG